MKLERMKKWRVIAGAEPGLHERLSDWVVGAH